MASLSHTTTDHDEIREWVEQHDGRPASVKGTESGDESGLAFLYQERKASGEDSTFFKLVSREDANT